MGGGVACTFCPISHFGAWSQDTEANFLKESMKLNLNLQWAGGFKPNIFCRGSLNFPEEHILQLDYLLETDSKIIKLLQSLGSNSCLIYVIVFDLFIHLFICLFIYKWR